MECLGKGTFQIQGKSNKSVMIVYLIIGYWLFTLLLFERGMLMLIKKFNMYFFPKFLQLCVETKKNY